MDCTLVESDVALRDGRVVHIRAMRPADEAEILQAFERMSSDARYMRFMRLVREPNIERLRTALASFPERGFGIVATVPAADGVDIVGSAIFVIGGNPTTCEFALSVDAAYGGAGLGRTLLTTLIEVARRRKLSEMEGFVLADNKSMLRLATRMGFSVERDPDDYALRVCTLKLASP